VVALAERAVQRAQCLDLLTGLQALGDDLEVQGLAELA